MERDVLLSSWSFRHDDDDEETTTPFPLYQKGTYIDELLQVPPKRSLLRTSYRGQAICRLEKVIWLRVPGGKALI